MNNIPNMSSVLLIVLLGACGSKKSETTECIYDSAQISGLEVSASQGDTVAMRELDLCYQFDHKDIDQRRIHEMRVRAGDPEALQEDAMLIAGRAEAETDIGKKIEMLERALDLAKTAARKQNHKIDDDIFVKYIANEIKSIQINNK